MICPESQYFDVNTVLRESTAYFLMERDLQQNRDWSWHGNLLLFSLPVSELLSLTEGICWEQPRPFIKFPFPLCDHISPSFFQQIIYRLLPLYSACFLPQSFWNRKEL